MRERVEALNRPDKVIAVIGGTSPGGREIAKQILIFGANVLILDPEVGDSVVELAQTPRGKGPEMGGILFQEIDYLIPSTIEKALKFARGHFVGSDLVGIVNCSGRDFPPEIADLLVVEPDSVRLLS